MTYWQAFKRGLYKERHHMLATVIAVLGWLVFAEAVTYWLGAQTLHVFIAIIAGWYWLGKVVIPWIENKLKP